MTALHLSLFRRKCRWLAKYYVQIKVDIKSYEITNKWDKVISERKHHAFLKGETKLDKKLFRNKDKSSGGSVVHSPRDSNDLCWVTLTTF